MHATISCFLTLSAMCLGASISMAETVTLPVKPLAECKFFDGETALKSTDAWKMEGGELVCSGAPRGYLVISQDEANYSLDLEWKWEGEGGNSGVLIHTIPGTSGFRTWASSIEVQLQNEMAGDIYAIGQLPGFIAEGSIFVAPGVPVVRIDRKATAEKPVGEWNHLQVIAEKDTLVVKVNGQTVNEISRVKPSQGVIALQSEGAPIRFRNMQVTRHSAE